MDQFIEAFVFTITGLLPITNPASTAPLFIALTRGKDPKWAQGQAIKACIYAFVILTTFLLAGDAIIEFFGISLPGIRIAGGIVILAIGIQMLFPQASAEPIEASENPQSESDIAMSPLAMPSLSGPGSIAVVLGIGTRITEEYEPIGFLAVICGIAVVIGFALLVLLSARPVVRLLGENLINAFTRIMGFILIAIAVEFAATGIKEFYGI